MKFEKYIYIGDIHGKKEFVEFINERDDGKTFFILMGDLFDRGSYSYEVIEKIKEKHKEGKLHLVLGNHDLFLIFGNLINSSKYTYKSQLLFNGGEKTLSSFERNIKYRKLQNKSVDEYVIEISNFLLENFDLYYVDDLGNLSIHGGIPILYDGTLVGDSFGYNNYIEGFDYVRKINELMKSKDEDTIEKLTGIYQTDSITRVINSVHGLGIGNYKMEKNFTMFLPTWFLNRLYQENDSIKEGMLKEMDKHGFKRFFCGHDGEYIVEDSEIKDERIIRLDRHIGFAVLNNKNELIESGLILTKSQKDKSERIKKYLQKMLKNNF